MSSGNYSFFASNIGKNGYCLWFGDSFGKRLIIEAATHSRITESDIISDSIYNLLKIKNNNDVGVWIIDNEYCFISVTDHLSKMISILTECINKNKSLKSNFRECDIIGFHLLSYLGVKVDIPFAVYKIEVQK